MYIAIDYSILQEDDQDLTLISALEYEDENSWTFQNTFSATSEQEFLDYIEAKQPKYICSESETFKKFSVETMEKLLKITIIQEYEYED